MAIVYPLDIPAAMPIAGVAITPRPFVGVNRSPFTGAAEVQVNQGQLWEARIEVANMERETAAVVNAFRLKLNGPEGTFLLGEPAAAVPRGAAATNPGTPLVNGAGQLGNDLVIDGAPISVTGWLLAFDWVQLGTAATARLYKCLTDVDTDAGGNATLTLWPKLNTQNTPADNDPLVVSNARGVFRLTPGQLGWSTRVDLTYQGPSFEAVSEA